MTRKIVTTLVLAPVALIVSGLVFAHLSEQPVDPVSALTGCGVSASANIRECLGECNIERMLCRQSCAPMPADCRDVPTGPDCALYEACLLACDQDWIDCKMMCS